MATADGTTQVITVTITGTNDAAVITGTTTASLTETNAAQSAGGNLDATDVDSSATFVAQTDVAGSNGYGKFSIDAAGAWTYTMDIGARRVRGRRDLHRQHHGGDGRRHDAGHHRHHPRHQRRGGDHRHGTASLTETNAAQTTGGTLDATDVDSSAAFVAQTDVAGSNGYGKFSIDAAGAWTYTMDNAHNEFVGGHDLHRQHHGGDGRRHDAGRHRHASPAPTTRR